MVLLPPLFSSLRGFLERGRQDGHGQAYCKHMVLEGRGDGMGMEQR